jgi:hypothetical protein
MNRLGLAAPTRYAGWPRMAARAVFALLILALLASFDALRLGTAGGSAPEGPGDLALYGGIVEAMRHGGDYYTTTAEALRAGGYPLRPFVTFRMPTLATVLATLPSWATLALLYTLAGGVFLAWQARLATALASPVARVGAAALLLAGLIAYVQPALIYFHEIWAGLFVALSLALHDRHRWVEAVAIGLAACVVRETAALYVLVMLGFALLSGARREAIGWIAALGVLAIVVVAHAWAVAQVVRPLDPVSPGWAGLPGFGAWVRAMAASTALNPVSLWIAAPIVVLALFGWSAWAGATGARAATTLAAYALLLTLGGRPDTFYWGLLSAAPLLVGLVFVPAASRDLLASASVRRRRITVTRIAR